MRLLLEILGVLVLVVLAAANAYVRGWVPWTIRDDEDRPARPEQVTEDDSDR